MARSAGRNAVPLKRIVGQASSLMEEGEEGEEGEEATRGEVQGVGASGLVSRVGVSLSSDCICLRKLDNFFIKF